MRLLAIAAILAGLALANPGTRAAIFDSLGGALDDARASARGGVEHSLGLH